MAATSCDDWSTIRARCACVLAMRKNTGKDARSRHFKSIAIDLHACLRPPIKGIVYLFYARKETSRRDGVQRERMRIAYEKQLRSASTIVKSAKRGNLNRGRDAQLPISTASRIKLAGKCTRNAESNQKNPTEYTRFQVCRRCGWLTTAQHSPIASSGIDAEARQEESVRASTFRGRLLHHVWRENCVGTASQGFQVKMPPLSR